MDKLIFTGSIVALITPMDDKGKICRTSLKKLIDYHVQSGTSAIVSVGTTGESSTLSYDERRDVVMMTLNFANDRIPVIAGTGSSATTECISLTQCFENTGVIGCLSVTPYYNCPSQEGLYQHFKAIAESTNLPQILYNVPIRTGCDMLPKTIARLAKIKNIIAIKEATGNLSRVNQIKEIVDDEFFLISGDDSTALDFMRLGGHGVISVTANIAAHEMAKLCHLVSEGNFTKAYRLNRKLVQIHQKLFVESNPAPVKWAAKKLGLIATDTLRLPMVPLSKKACSVVEKAMKRANLL